MAAVSFPLVPDPDRKRVLNALAAIAARLRSTPEHLQRAATLAWGHPGIALFHVYHAAWSGEGESLAALQASVRFASASLGALPDEMLFGGTLGLGFVLSHLTTNLVANDPSGALDERLNPLADARIAGYDLVGGLCGVGVYLLERQALPETERLLLNLLDSLEQTAIPYRDGIAWERRPEWIGGTDRAHFPGGYVDYGLAHGSAGVIALLARMCDFHIAPERTSRLLIRACSALQSVRLSGGRFPDHSRTAESTRVAWCYGSLGIAAALLAASHALEDRALRDAAVESAAAAVFCPFEQTAVRDASLCHGAAGVMHISQIFHRATGDEVFAEGAARWLRVLLSMREGENAWRAALPREGGVEYVDDPGFLIGLAGIGLALLALVDDKPPLWNRILLMPQEREDG